MRTLLPDLLTAQAAGYPTGGYAPAVRCILTSKDGGTTYDYSFDPTVTTNRLLHVQQVEEKENDYGVILLSNYDGAIPTDLAGYYVDIGWGLNTAAGVAHTGAASPRLWVMEQWQVSGGPKGSKPGLHTVLVMGGAWNAVLDQQPVRVGVSPLYRYDVDYVTAGLQNKTIYGAIEYLIESGLFAQTGLSFTLDALGTQDDGAIDTLIPFPYDAHEEDLMRTINADSPGRLETYGAVIKALLQLTKCTMITRADLAFKIIYPQEGDSVNETYHSSLSAGHPFYEAEDRRLNMTPNHFEVIGYWDGVTEIIGDWFDSDHYTTAPTRPFNSDQIEDYYTGPFMPVTESIYEEGLNTNTECTARAEYLGWHTKDKITGTRVIIPMDASVELGDRIAIDDQRGH